MNFKLSDKIMYNSHLETFLIVADSSSFSKASQKLFISPTAVIKQINLLENEIGFPLFYRDNKKFKLFIMANKLSRRYRLSNYSKSRKRKKTRNAL